MTNFKELATKLDELKAKNLENMTQAEYDKYAVEVNALKAKITESVANPYPERNLVVEIDALVKTLVGFPEFKIRLEDIKKRGQLKGTKGEQDRYINDLNSLKSEINALLDQRHLDEVKKAEDAKDAKKKSAVVVA